MKDGAWKVCLAGFFELGEGAGGVNDFPGYTVNTGSMMPDFSTGAAMLFLSRRRVFESYYPHFATER